MRKDHVYILISVCRRSSSTSGFFAAIINANAWSFNVIKYHLLIKFTVASLRDFGSKSLETVRLRRNVKSGTSWNVANQETKTIDGFPFGKMYFRAHKIYQNPPITRRSSNQTVISNDHVHTIRSFSTSLTTTREGMDRTKQRENVFFGSQFFRCRLLFSPLFSN